MTKTKSLHCLEGSRRLREEKEGLRIEEILQQRQWQATQTVQILRLHSEVRTTELKQKEKRGREEEGREGKREGKRECVSENEKKERVDREERREVLTLIVGVRMFQGKRLVSDGFQFNIQYLPRYTLQYIHWILHFSFMNLFLNHTCNKL